MKDQIAKTERRREDLIAKSKAVGDAGRQGGEGTTGRNVTDPSQNSLLQLQSQLQATQAEIANREQAVAALKSRVNGYQGRLNDEPAREQQLADLTRGYDQSKANYDDLLKKKNESKMATSMELLQQGERFRIVDPPSY